MHFSVHFLSLSRAGGIVEYFVSFGMQSHGSLSGGETRLTRFSLVLLSVFRELCDEVGHGAGLIVNSLLYFLLISFLLSKFYELSTHSRGQTKNRAAATCVETV